jgi:nucleoside-triphosphatase THEP1
MDANIFRRAARIGVITAESGAEKQALLKQFADRRRGEGLRVAGVVELAAPDSHSDCGALDLLDLATGARIAISQNLGPGSTACNLDPGGVAMACAAAQRAIEAGADLVVLSKFGKLEAGNGGLRDAFAAAMAAETPALTTLKPAMRDEWANFAGPLFDELPPQLDALENWWRGLARKRSAA